MDEKTPRNRVLCRVPHGARLGIGGTSGWTGDGNEEGIDGMVSTSVTRLCAACGEPLFMHTVTLQDGSQYHPGCTKAVSPRVRVRQLEAEVAHLRAEVKALRELWDEAETENDSLRVEAPTPALRRAAECSIVAWKVVRGGVWDPNGLMDEHMDALRKALGPNATMKPLDPLDVEEMWDQANADERADEVHHAFARLLERAHGIGVEHG